MKESTGELVAALAVMIAVGIFIAFFYYTLWPVIKQNFDGSTQCSRAICPKCEDPNGCEYVTCHIKGSDETIDCIYRG